MKTIESLEKALEAAAKALNEAHDLIIDLRVDRNLSTWQVDHRARAVLIAAAAAYEVLEQGSE